MNIGLCCDHAGFPLKMILEGYLDSMGYKFTDYGCYTAESCDYADYAHPCAEALLKKEVDCAVAICGSGNGIAMTLNKHAGIRAAICWQPELASLARQHNDANILVLPARFIDEATAISCFDTFIETKFEGGRHQRRIDKIDIKQNPA